MNPQKVFYTVLAASLLLPFNSSQLNAASEATHAPLKLNIKRKTSSGMVHYDKLSQEIPKSFVKVQKKPLLTPTLNTAKSTSASTESIVGTIITEDGYILTCYPSNDFFNTFEDEVIIVTLLDGRYFSAQYLGRDANTQTVLLKINGEKLPSIVQGNSDMITNGDISYKMDLNEGRWEAKQGSITNKGAAMMSCNTLSAQAPIIGSPLLDLEGTLVGICCSQQNSMYVPINNCRAAMLQLFETSQTQARIGFSGQKLKKNLAVSLGVNINQGLLINTVSKESIAYKAGLREGDVIVAVNEYKISDLEQLKNVISQAPVGKELYMKVVRNGKFYKTRLPGLEQPFALTTQQTYAGNCYKSTHMLKGIAFSTEGGSARISGHPVVVSNLDPDSPFMKYFHEGMGIVSVNNRPIYSIEDLNDALKLGANNLFLTSYKGHQKYISFDLN